MLTLTNKWCTEQPSGWVGYCIEVPRSGIPVLNQVVTFLNGLLDWQSLGTHKGSRCWFGRGWAQLQNQKGIDLFWSAIYVIKRLWCTMWSHFWNLLHPGFYCQFFHPVFCTTSLNNKKSLQAGKMARRICVCVMFFLKFCFRCLSFTFGESVPC